MTQVRLSVSGASARIVPDTLDAAPDVPGSSWILEIDGREQSHVDLADPTSIRYEYLRRIANVLDTAAAAAAPLRILHLGAGALTLARYVQATRPGSPQVAVELERELPDLVLRALPLPAGGDVTILVADARDAVEAMDDEMFDAVVLDVFDGADSPAHLATEDFYRLLLDRLTARGVLVVNVGDEPGLRFWAGQALALADAADAAGCAGIWTLADAGMLALDREGNLVLAAGPGVSPEARSWEEVEALAERWRQAGPHPAAVLDPEETEDLAERLA